MAGTLEKLRPSDLATFHKNPRVGNVDAIAASLRINDQYRPIVVNKGTHTGRPYEVLAGNHTLKAVRDLAEKYPDDERWQNIDCWVLDVDDDRAARIVAADNRTAELGTFDDEALFELLSDLPNLEGTGYEEHDLSALEYLLGDGDSDTSDNHSGSDDDDQRILDDSDQAAWPTVKARIAPELYARFDEIPGDGHDEKLTALIREYSELREAIPVNEEV